jgi:hypothetical protein
MVMDRLKNMRYLILSSIKDSLSSITASNGKTVVGDELDTVQRGATVIYFGYYPNILLDVVTRNTKNPPG